MFIILYIMIKNPFIKNIEYTRISLDAYYMNSNIKNNLFNILKKKLENKCNKNGYIDKIYRITEYSDGIIRAENFNGSAIYDIAYYCKIYNPSENKVIIGFIKIINQELIIAIHGPIVIFIPKDKIDLNIWNLENNTFINKIKKKELALGDYITIRLENVRINQNDTQIKTLGSLIDIPNKEEIDMYFLYNNNEDNKESNYII